MLLALGLLGAVLAVQGTLALPDEADYTPIVVPLAVRGPYLGAYLTGRAEKDLATMDPHFWTTEPLGWKGLLRVDGEPWNWMGNLTDWPACSTTTSKHAAAETSYTHTNSPATVSITASFLSPITPADLFRQSLPFSYLQLTVHSLDGQPHTVEAYSEINGLWLADEEDEPLVWEEVKGEKGDWVGVRAKLENQRPYVEAKKVDPWSGEEISTDRVLQGEVYYAVQTSSRVQTSFSAGDDAMVTRRAFASSGSLASHANSTSPRPIRTRSSSNASLVLDEPVFALSHSFGTVGPSTPLASRTALLAIGHVRSPLVRYTVAGSGTSLGPDDKTRPSEEVIELRPLWRSTFSSPEKMLSFFFSDFATAKELSEQFNAKLYEDARAVDGQEYAHVVAISTRQVFMALEAVWDESEEGRRAEEGLVAYSPLTGEPVPAMVMLKEISSNGNAQTIDVITPFLPFLLHSTPSLLPLLLEPIYRYMSSGLYVPVPPAHDLGDHYPNATGHSDFLYPGLPIEEAGNMLLLALSGMRVAQPSTAPLAAHMKVKQWWDERVGGGARSVGWEAKVGSGRDHRREGARMALMQAKERYSLLRKWAEYLEQECLYPGDQRTTDDFFGSAPNQTSLVVKGILGMRAFSEIAGELGEERDQQYFRDVSDRYRDTFLDLAIAKDGTHLLGAYGNQTSWVTQYNLYFDKLLGLSVFPSSVYEMQDAFYETVAEPYGPPLDWRFPTRTKTDWLAWAGATCGSPSSPSSPTNPCRRLFLDGLAEYFRASKNAVFGDAITPQEGWSVGFLSRPVAGGHYALLAAEVMAQERDRRRQREKEGESAAFFTLAAGVAVALVSLLAARSLIRWRRRRGGYVELGGGRGRGYGAKGRRASEMDGGRETWTAADSPQSVFELGLAGEDSDEEDGSDTGETRKLARRV
ncbi:hypothetical protein JCM10213_007718 [Rhodosporidiobolus nylandii]